MIPTFPPNFGSRKLIYALDMPSFQRDFASLKTLDHGTGPAITFTRNSNATYFDADGALQTAATNAPRFDHDPATGASRGLLIEEARTNSIRNSQAGGSTNGVLGSGGVAPTNWIITANANGITSEIIGTGTENGFAYIDIKVSGTPTSTLWVTIAFESFTGVVASNAQTWTNSVYLKRQSGSLSNVSFNVGVQGRDSGGNFVSGQVAQNSASVGDTLARAFATLTMSSASVAKVLPYAQVFYTNGQLIDVTLRIAAPQLEQGAFATSYIPTTNAAATRAADSAVVTPISSFYNPTESTLFHETTVYADAATPAVFQIDDTSTVNRIFVAAEVGATSSVAGMINSGSQLFGVSANLAAGTHKVCAAFKTDDFAVSTNGAAVATDNSGTMPTGLSHARFGNNANTPNTCHIRKIAYWPKRLTNTLLEQLTT